MSQFPLELDRKNKIDVDYVINRFMPADKVGGSEIKRAIVEADIPTLQSLPDAKSVINTLKSNVIASVEDKANTFISKGANAINDLLGVQASSSDPEIQSETKSVGWLDLLDKTLDTVGNAVDKGITVKAEESQLNTTYLVIGGALLLLMLRK
jgi:hypothetical protein